MFSHVFVSVTDFDRAMAFYRPVMAALGLQEKFSEPDVPWTGWHSAGGGRPLFLVGKPVDGAPHASGNGQMTAFIAASRAVVDAAHEQALRHGGLSEGAPGLRPQYHANYNGAYLRDPDGNKLAVACHEAA